MEFLVDRVQALLNSCYASYQKVVAGAWFREVDLFIDFKLLCGVEEDGLYALNELL